MERTGGNQQAVPEGTAGSDVPPGHDPEAEPADETLDRPLPEGVRHRVVAVAADAFGALTTAELPTQLRQYARFTPTRRAKFAGNALAAALESDPVFRQRIATRLRETQTELAAALDGGTPPPAADPLDVAAAAYLLRPAGWAKLVAAAGEEAQRAHAEHVGEETARELQQVKEELAALRAASHDEARAARAELDVGPQGVGLPAPQAAQRHQRPASAVRPRCARWRPSWPRRGPRPPWTWPPPRARHGGCGPG